MQAAARIGIYVLVFAAGAGVGAYVSFRMAEAKAFAHEMVEVSHYSAYLQAQRTQGSDAAYEAALKSYLASLDVRSKGPSPIFPDSVYAVDSALTYARLSILASKRGAKDESANYLKKASDLCPRLGWKDCSAVTITEMALRLDKERPTQ
jgi:hypothetical protein